MGGDAGDLAGGDVNIQHGHVGGDLAADAAEDSAEAVDGAGLEEGIHVFFAWVRAGWNDGCDGWLSGWRRGGFDGLEDGFGIYWLGG